MAWNILEIDRQLWWVQDAERVWGFGEGGGWFKKMSKRYLGPHD